MSSVPFRLWQKVIVRWPDSTSAALTAATSLLAEARTPVSSSMTGGSSSANRRGPVGEPSSVMAVTGAAHSADASRSGWPIVAEVKTKTGSEP